MYLIWGSFSPVCCGHSGGKSGISGEIPWLVISDPVLLSDLDYLFCMTSYICDRGDREGNFAEFRSAHRSAHRHRTYIPEKKTPAGPCLASVQGECSPKWRQPPPPPGTRPPVGKPGPDIHRTSHGSRLEVTLPGLVPRRPEGKKCRGRSVQVVISPQQGPRAAPARWRLGCELPRDAGRTESLTSSHCVRGDSHPEASVSV